MGDRSPEQYAAIHFEIGEKLKKFFFFLKVKNHENHRNDLSCQIVILRGVFHFLYPKLFFSYISRHVLSDYVSKKNPLSEGTASVIAVCAGLFYAIIKHSSR